MIKELQSTHKRIEESHTANQRKIEKQLTAVAGATTVEN